MYQRLNYQNIRLELCNAGKAGKPDLCHQLGQRCGHGRDQPLQGSHLTYAVEKELTCAPGHG